MVSPKATHLAPFRRASRLSNACTLLTVLHVASAISNVTIRLSQS